ncbi:unnamed protein product [Cyprideis torosa]|uniref:Uncharacterized protein n=1 Tax=Cyprideis torosa TaxID=163714 RepID=A0A7R8ZUL4_9CRUS|nr:unnamed protein product [Cyprideis torosa]CAG0906251.1 unnamed protein product [Cyprideis torosa]
MCKACNDGPTPDIPNVQNAADPALVLYQPEVECLPDWLYFPLTFRCYFYDATYRTWEHARDNCTARGGELTPVRNRDENDFVFNMSTAGSFGYLWFGGNDFKVENEWEFLDGTKLTWTNFNLNQPENSTTQQCLAIRRDINLWHDLICSSNNPSVCSNYPTLA